MSTNKCLVLGFEHEADAENFINYFDSEVNVLIEDLDQIALFVAIMSLDLETLNASDFLDEIISNDIYSSVAGVFVIIPFGKMEKYYLTLNK